MRRFHSTHRAGAAESRDFACICGMLGVDIGQRGLWLEYGWNATAAKEGRAMLADERSSHKTIKVTGLTGKRVRPNTSSAEETQE